ncbi:solute symporter family transporter [Hysterangium stoloniferum]|nr:solute symporter family transporter [Hysterangium stoloniferum]
MSTVVEFKPLLPQSVGYGVVVGVGFFFAALMLLLTNLQRKFTSLSPDSSEEACYFIYSLTSALFFLINWNCISVSAWTWSATLLQSSTAAYTFGVSGPWWYGVGGTIQLSIFTMVAAKIKMNANGAHTFLEIVKVRFGTSAHILFTFYGLLCNLVVCGSLLLGGAATVNALTGMNIDAACFLLPVGIGIYVVFGGLRATFICDWSHTVILFIIIYIFLFKTFGTSDILGSPTAMYDLLVTAAQATPVVGNAEGSYLTMKSNQGLVFGAATILSGFAGIFCDQGYWQRAIASSPESTTKAYMLGGISWFSVPWAFASCMGLAARALITNPLFPTYPEPLSASQASAGLAAPAAAAVLMGKGGAVAVLLVVFMAVTSAASAELIAVSSILYGFTFPRIYRTYWRKNATGAEIVRVSHIFIGAWAIWMGAWAVILHKVNIDLGWLFYVQGVVLSPAVIPIGLTVTWSKLSKTAVFAGTFSGFVTGMLAWMIGCWKIYGSINIPNLAQPYSAVCSGLTSILFSGIITVGLSFLYPANYDFAGTRAMSIIDPIQDPELGSARVSTHDMEEKDQKDEKNASAFPKMPSSDVVQSDPTVPREALQRAFKRAAIPSLVLTMIVVIVPLPMFFSNYIFSPKFFAFWIGCSMIWALLAGGFCIVLPLWESKAQIGSILMECLTLGHKMR